MNLVNESCVEMHTCQRDKSLPPEKEKDSSIGWVDYLYEVGQALMQGATGERRMHGYATLNDMKRRKLREKEKHWCEGFRKEKKKVKIGMK